MIQKEVAERISAPPGSKTYGILSVLLQAFYDIKYLFTVNENVFTPPPKVKSAVIRFVRNSTVRLDCNEELFFKIVKASFNQRRKTLRNSLRSFYKPETLTSDIFNLRPERLSVQDFVGLTKMANIC
jgi:16S rRNA (adenine1518-N6/adenine1519-N6)-dimethyltransferase